MTPEQSKAARALIGMTQPQLAKASGLGLSTIVDYEKTRRKVAPDSVAAIQNALEKAGIEFISPNGGGAGVRLGLPE